MLLRFPILLMLAALAGPACARIEVRLKDFAEAKSHQVVLSDIAVLDSNAEGVRLETLEKMVIATITHIDQPLRIEAGQLMRVMARQQPALRDKMQFTGAAAVSVVLPGQAFPAERVTEAAKSFVRAELGRHASRFEIHDARMERDAVSIPRGELQLKPRLIGSATPAAKMHIAVDMFVNGRRVDSVPVSVEISMALPVYRLTRSMTMGETLKPEDCEIVEQAIDPSMRIASLLDPATDLSALRLRRNIAAHALLYREDIERIPDVSRNQKVLAELKNNGIVIEKTVVAQADGQLGQIIKVADAQSAATYSARVIAHGRVEVK